MPLVAAMLLALSLLGSCEPLGGFPEREGNRANGAVMYTVTFDANGGTPATKTQRVASGGKAVAPKGITNASLFLGDWYRQKSGSTLENRWDFENDIVTEDITLYAEWNEQCLVTFNSKGGTPIASKKVVFGQKVERPADPQKTGGYVFENWYEDEKDSAEPWDFDWPVSGSMTLFAKYLTARTVTFDARGGEPATQQQIVGQGRTVAVPPTEVKRAGYTFRGWHKDEGCTIPWNFASDTVPDRNITLYAKWEITAGERMSRTIQEGETVTFRYVPSGSFQRDSNAANVSVITKGYWMADTEVTQALFREIMDARPSSFTNGADNGEEQKLRPVEQVNWYDAIAFCNKLSLADGKDPVYSVKVSGVEVDWANLAYAQIPAAVENNAEWDAATMDTSKNGYRLPTEMEWFWAAMGADKDNPGQRNTTGYDKAFAGSNGSNSVGDYAWYYSNSNNKTHEVAKKQPNELQLYDMSGNVWEWCWDRYGDYPSGTQTDYAGPSFGSNRVRRGGSWLESVNVRPDSRFDTGSPYQRARVYGIRVVCP